MEGWQSGQMQRTVNPSTNVYDGSNPSPSTSDTAAAIQQESSAGRNDIVLELERV